MIKLCPLIFVLFFSSFAHAITFELGAFYFSDDLSSTNNLANKKTIYDLAILMTSEGRRTFGVGWNYAGVNSAETNPNNVTYSSTETGPKFTYLFGKEKDWYLGFTYNLLAKAQFEDQSGSAEWRGTSMKLEGGFIPRITSKLSVGLKLNYHAANYTEQITNSTTLIQSSNKKTMIYPSLALIYSL